MFFAPVDVTYFDLLTGRIITGTLNFLLFLLFRVHSSYFVKLLLERYLYATGTPILIKVKHTLTHCV